MHRRHRSSCRPLSRCAPVLLFAAGTVLLPQVAPGQTYIGRNFTASTRGADSTFIPPDTMGAAGVDHFVELINGRYSVYRKSDGVRVQTSTLDSFWSSAGAPHSGAFSFDPRVLYDPYVKRWYALSVDNARGANSFLFAISNSANPTAGWRGFKIDADADDTHWADFPMMGHNGEAIVLSANMFPISTGSTNKTFVVIPKADLLTAAPSVGGATRFEAISGTATGFSVQPAVDMDNGSLPLPLLSSASTTTLKRSSIGGSAFSPSIITSGGTISVGTSNFSPPTADQPGPKANINTGGDTRFSGNVVLNNGELWGVHTISSGGRAALRWYRVNAATNAIIESGIINDPSLAYFFPSIAVNDLGDVVIGMSGTDPSTFVSTYAVAGKTAGGVTTFGTPFMTKAGVSDYERLDSSGRNRWGDYSATTVDPADPSIFWTIQEFVSATDQWSTQVSEIITPQPGEVRWKDPAGGNYTDASAWLAGTVPGSGDHVIFSRATSPGTAGYTVTLSVGASATVDRFSHRQGTMSLDLGGNTLIASNASISTPSVTVGEFGGTPALRLRGTGTLASVNGVIAPGTLSIGTVILQDNAAWNTSNSLFIAGDHLAAGGAGTLVLQSGTPRLEVANVMQVWSGGNVHYNAGTFNTGTLVVDGGRVRVGNGGGKVIRTTQLSIEGGGRIDLTDNSLIVDYPAGSDYLAYVRAQIQSAYNGGAWDGSGIATSMGDTSTFGLGYAEAADLGLGTFAGQSVDDTTVVVRFTRFGDANLDGTVSLQDFNRLAANFGAVDSFWHFGDFNYDGFVNLQDFNRLAGNFGLSAGPDGPTPDDWANLAAAVPEPAGWVAALLATLLSPRRWGRSCRSV